MIRRPGSLAYPRRFYGLLVGVALLEVLLPFQGAWRVLTVDWWWVLVVVLSLQRVRWLGMEVAFLWGLMADALRTEVLGVYAASYALVVFVLGYLEPSLLATDRHRRFIVGLLLAVCLALQLALRAGFSLPLDWPFYFARALWSFGAWWLMDQLVKRVLRS